jgi:hypothetical protein
MQPAQYGPTIDVPCPLNSARYCRILLQGYMRAHLVTVFHVRQQNMTKMPLAEHDNVVKTLPSDRTDQPFGISVWGTRRRRLIANTHRSKSSDENFTIRSIAIAVQIVGKLLPSAGFRYLVCDPFRSRMRGDSEPNDLSSAMPRDQQTIEQTGTTNRSIAAMPSVDQIEGFRMGDKDGKRDDDLLDTFCYGIAVSLGNSEGF